VFNRKASGTIEEEVYLSAWGFDSKVINHTFFGRLLLHESRQWMRTDCTEDCSDHRGRTHMFRGTHSVDTHDMFITYSDTSTKKLHIEGLWASLLFLIPTTWSFLY